MARNKDFDAQHKAMKALYETMERDQTWENPEQRFAAGMVMYVLWTMARCHPPAKVAFDILQKHMAVLDPTQEGAPTR
jgi:hypothetical protein